METGHPSTRAVNLGRQLGLWKPGFRFTTDNVLWYAMNSFSERLKAELFRRAYKTDLASMWQLTVNSLREHKFYFLLTYLLNGLFHFLKLLTLKWFEVDIFFTNRVRTYFWDS